jgi:hypothetical protein
VTVTGLDYKNGDRSTIYEESPTAASISKGTGIIVAKEH